MKEQLIDDVEKRLQKRNPWQPYTGPAGGQGWVNVITGEVRYQDSQPGAEEGMPEGYDGEVPVDDAPDELGDPEPLTPEPEDLPEFLEEGMEVTYEHPDDGLIESQVLGISDGGNVLLEDADGDSFMATPHDIEEHPVELEPPDGWADGWEAGPDHFTDLERGQTVELYDLESGEYLSGEVQLIEEDDPDFDGDYLSVVTEEAGTVEIAPGVGVGEDLLITAQEDLDFVPGIPEIFDELAPDAAIDQLGRLQEGDRAVVLMDNDIFGDEPVEVIAQGDDTLQTAEEVDGAHRMIDLESEAHAEQLDRAWTDLPEMASLDDVHGWEHAPEILAGSFAVMDHPTFGEVEGEVDVSTDPHGHDWLTVQADPVPTEGDRVSLGGLEYEVQNNEFHPEADTNIVDVVDVDSGEEMEFVEEDVIDLMDTEEASLTTNPDHPLFVGDHLRGVDQPWTDAENLDEVGIGDTVSVDGEVGTAIGQWEDGSLMVDPVAEGAGEFEADPVDVEQAVPAETHDSPDFEDWQDPPVDGSDYKHDDTVEYYDPEADELKVDAVNYADDDSIELAGGEQIQPGQVRSWADTGEVQLPTGDPIGEDDIGEYVHAAYRTEDGEEIREIEGYITNGSGHAGWMDVYDPQTGEVQRIGAANEGVIMDRPEPDHDHHRDLPTGEAIQEFTESLNLAGHAVDKSEFRGTLTTFFEPDAVQGLTAALHGPRGTGGWKQDSSGHSSNKWEEALAEAAGITAPTLGGESPSSAEVEVAEAIHEASKERWRQNTPQRVYRGLGDHGAAGLMANFLEDPFEADEYDVPTRAVANWTEQQSTAESLGTSPLVVYRHGDETPADWVAAYHDDFFPSSHDQEAEISLRGDKATVPRDQMYANKDTDVNFADPPHEWNTTVAEAFHSKVSNYGADILFDKNPHTSPTINQLQNAVRIERVLSEKHGMSTHGMEFFDEARQALRDYHDIEPEGVEYPELHQQGYGPGAGDPPDLIHDTDDFVEGMIVSGVADGNPVDGEVEAVTDDGVRVGTELGTVVTLAPSEVDEVIESPKPYGAPAQADTSDLTADDFEQLDTVHLWNGIDWEEATVLDPSDPDAIEVSRATGMTDYYDEQDLQNGRLVPPDLVGDPAEDGDGPIPWEEGDVIDTAMYTEPVEVVDVSGDEVTIEDGAGYQDTYGPDHANWVDIEGSPVVDEVGGFEEGQEVHISNDLPEDHPEHIDEQGTIGEPTTHGGELYYPVLDDNGTVINEWTADGLEDLGAEPEGSAGNEWGVDPDGLDVGDTIEVDPMAPTFIGAGFGDGQDLHILQEEVGGDGFYVGPHPDTPVSEQEYVDPDDIIDVTGDGDGDDGDGGAFDPAVGDSVMVPHYDDEGPFEIVDVVDYHGSDGYELETGTVLTTEEIEPAEGPADDWSPEDVSAGDEVMVPHYDDEGPHEVMAVSESAGDPTFQLHNGDLLTAYEVEAPEDTAEGSADDGDGGDGDASVDAGEPPAAETVDFGDLSWTELETPVPGSDFEPGDAIQWGVYGDEQQGIYHGENDMGDLVVEPSPDSSEPTGQDGLSAITAGEVDAVAADTPEGSADDAGDWEVAEDAFVEYDLGAGTFRARVERYDETEGGWVITDTDTGSTMYPGEYDNLEPLSPPVNEGDEITAEFGGETYSGPVVQVDGITIGIDADGETGTVPVAPEEIVDVQPAEES